MNDPCIDEAIAAVANTLRKEACQKAGLLARARGIELDNHKIADWLWGEEAKEDFKRHMIPITIAGVRGEDVEGMYHQLVTDWSARLLEMVKDD